MYKGYIDYLLLQINFIEFLKNSCQIKCMMFYGI